MNNEKNVSPQGEVNQSEVQVSNTELDSSSTDMGSQNDTHADLSEAPIQEGQVENLTTADGKQLDIAVQDSVFRAKLHADMESKGAIKQE